MTPSPEQFANALVTENDEQLSRADFGTSVMLASAAVWSPNPDNTPFYIDLPYKDGELQTDVVARWVANAPLVLMHQYIPQLKSFEDVLIDAGDRDSGIAATVVEMDAILNSYGVKHRSEIYEGDHVSGIHERITSHLMPMFSDVLVEQ